MTNSEEGTWRIDNERVESPYRYVHDGNEYLLELSSGVWKHAAFLPIRTVAEGFVRATGLAVGMSGKVYVSDGGDHRVYEIDPATGMKTPIAGTGGSGLRW